ncbi:MAG: adenosylmethionine decarboxylase [Pseudanabaenaceae cyanobacterium bins.68]|nr:adenosylmethionine decarboxylase [Pseudanabaenaceae cyanobacterium bins.68]
MLQLKSEFGKSTAVLETHEPVGVHYILEIYECPSTVLNDLEYIMECLRGAVKCAGATLLNQVAHQFSPQGVTALMLLAESHISIHTWPESGYAALDVFTCGSHTMPDLACAYLIDKLQAKRHLLFKMPRNTELPEA